MAAPLSRSSCVGKLRHLLKYTNLTVYSKQPPTKVYHIQSRTIAQKARIPNVSKKIRIGLGVAVLSSVFATGLFRKVKAATEIRPISRSVKGVIDIGDQKFTLYQFQSCPYCCKVRAALDYFGFPYDVVEVNSVTKQQIKFSEYKKVPILVVDGEVGDKDFTLQFNDSSVIVSLLASYMYDPVPLQKLQPCYPTMKEKGRFNKIIWDFPNKYFIMYGENIADSRTEKQRNNSNNSSSDMDADKTEDRDERHWRKWTDDILMHTISPNVYRTASESLEAFHHFSEWGEWDKNFSTVSRLFVVYVGAIAMYFIGKMVKKKYRIKDNPRESLYDACDEWMRAVGKKQFLGGKKPNLADLTVYGSLHSFEGCLAHNELMSEHRVKDWYRRMEEQIYSHQGAATLTELPTKYPNHSGYKGQ